MHPMPSCEANAHVWFKYCPLLFGAKMTHFTKKSFGVVNEEERPRCTP